MTHEFSFATPLWGHQLESFKDAIILQAAKYDMEALVYQGESTISVVLDGDPQKCIVYEAAVKAWVQQQIFDQEYGDAEID